MSINRYTLFFLLRRVNQLLELFSKVPQRGSYAQNLKWSIFETLCGADMKDTSFFIYFFLAERMHKQSLCYMYTAELYTNLVDSYAIYIAIAIAIARYRSKDLYPI